MVLIEWCDRPQVTMATAQVLYHRFYYRVSFKQYSAKVAAKGALFLAAKAEETPKKIRDVLNVFHHLERKFERGLNAFDPLDVHNNKYFELKSDLVKMERYILKELGFFVTVEHPHKYLLNYLRILEGNEQLTQLAWNYVNDRCVLCCCVCVTVVGSLRTSVCVRFNPAQVATACIYFAARMLLMPLPDRWWELFDTSKADVEDICYHINQLYCMEKAVYIPVSEPAASTTPMVSLQQASMPLTQDSQPATPERPPDNGSSSLTSPPHPLPTIEQPIIVVDSEADTTMNTGDSSPNASRHSRDKHRKRSPSPSRRHRREKKDTKQ